MKIAVVLGTRPEIIKLSPVIRELVRASVPPLVIHTNQHFSPEMDAQFFSELKLAPPTYNLGVNNLSHSVMIGEMLLKLEPILLSEQPDWLLVQGDTNSTLAGALAGAKLGIKLGHIEAGLRSYDHTMPEEQNRVVVDHLANLLLAPTQAAIDNLLREGIDRERIKLTGNTIVDAVHENLKLAKPSQLAPGSYLLLTLHRPSNVDHEPKLRGLILALERLAKTYSLPLIFPVHPRTRAALHRFGILPDSSFIKLQEPTTYLEMLGLIKDARLVLTDSGGVIEEACIMHTPCLTLRDNTERPETVEVGANLVVGADATAILDGAKQMLAKEHDWPNPFGDGHAATTIITSLT